MTIEDVGIIILSVYNHPNKWLQIPLEKALGKVHITHVQEHCRIFLQGGPVSPGVDRLRICELV